MQANVCFVSLFLVLFGGFTLIFGGISYYSCNEYVDANIINVDYIKSMNVCHVSLQYVIYNGGVYQNLVKNLPCDVVQFGLFDENVSVPGCYYHFSPEMFYYNMYHPVSHTLAIPFFVIGGISFVLIMGGILFTVLLAPVPKPPPLPVGDEDVPTSSIQRRDSAMEMGRLY